MKSIHGQWLDGLTTGSRVSATCVADDEPPVWAGTIEGISPKRARFLVQWDHGVRTYHDGGGSFYGFMPKRIDVGAFDGRYGQLEELTPKKAELATREGVIRDLADALAKFDVENASDQICYRLAMEIRFAGARVTAGNIKRLVKERQEIASKLSVAVPKLEP